MLLRELGKEQLSVGILKGGWEQNKKQQQQQKENTLLLDLFCAEFWFRCYM